MSRKVLRHYITDIEDRTVIAVNHKCRNVVTEAANNCKLNTVLIAHMLYQNPDLGIMDTCEPLESTARCMKGDKFDPEVGREIADTKLMMKYHNRMSKDYEKMIRAMQTAIDEMIVLKNRHDQKANAIEKDLHRVYLKK